MADFERAIAFVLKHEGGYVNSPNDPGGETNFGISKRANPTVDIRALTRETATAIYRARYWDPIQGDALPDCVGLALLDWYVHSGTPAVQALQRLVGVIADGVLGPATLLAVKDRAWNVDTDRDLAERLCAARALFAGRWIAARPAERGAFAPGFMRRFVDLVAAFTVEDLSGG